MTRSDTARILVVDDDADTCQNLTDILIDAGYATDNAYDALAALELVRAKPYDVVLLDYKMPGMDGLTLYREIRKIRASTVAVIVSAYSGTMTPESARAAGAWQVLPKPVDLPRLLGLVNEALDQPLVMVVDDDSDLCMILWDLLRDQGYRVCVANDERQAAERIGERDYIAVLLDLKLSEHDGGERVYQLVRQSNPKANVVLITGHRDEVAREIERLLAEGANAVCYKPFDINQLLDTLKQLTTSTLSRTSSL